MGFLIDHRQAFVWAAAAHAPWPLRILAPTAVSRPLEPGCSPSAVSRYLHAQTCTSILSTHTSYSIHTYCTRRYGSDVPPWLGPTSLLYVFSLGRPPRGPG